MTSPHYDSDGITVYAGDCLDVLRQLPDASVDSVCTDPPYGLEFMGKEWDAPWKADGTVLTDPASVGGFQDGNGGNPFSRSRIRFGTGVWFQQWCQLWAIECLRVLKPGGHMLAFGGTRTWHRLACAIEDAGFEIRDSIAWLYGSGFPKSLDVSKAIDKAVGATREVVGYRKNLNRTAKRDEAGPFNSSEGGMFREDRDTFADTAPATDDARKWSGYGTALKPAHEPIVVARKPLNGTVAANVLAHGTGALNIDGCRVEGDVPQVTQGLSRDPSSWSPRSKRQLSNPHAAGRWPANVVLDESQAAALDAMSGESVSGKPHPRNGTEPQPGWGLASRSEDRERGHADSGGASRYFYTAKADSNERIRVPSASGGAAGSIANQRCALCGKTRISGTRCECPEPVWVKDDQTEHIAHPTVKPLSLMRWLVRLVTPPGGIVLDPFAGSGTTVEACILEGFRCVAIEREADYLPLITQRIHRRRDPAAYVKASGDDGGLFDLLDEETPA